MYPSTNSRTRTRTRTRTRSHLLDGRLEHHSLWILWVFPVQLDRVRGVVDPPDLDGLLSIKPVCARARVCAGVHVATVCVYVRVCVRA